jgi:hypothetical protein
MVPADPASGQDLTTCVQRQQAPAARPRPGSGTTPPFPGLPHRPAVLAARTKPSSETVMASARHLPDPTALQFTRTRPAHSVTLMAGNPASRTHNRRSVVINHAFRDSRKAGRCGDPGQAPGDIVALRWRWCGLRRACCRRAVSGTAVSRGRGPCAWWRFRRRLGYRRLYCSAGREDLPGLAVPEFEQRRADTLDGAVADRHAERLDAGDPAEL